MSQGQKRCRLLTGFRIGWILCLILGLTTIGLIMETMMTPKLHEIQESNPPTLETLHSLRDDALNLKRRRRQEMSKYPKVDYQCDYLHAKGQGKSGTTYLKLLLRLIEETLCQNTDYRHSYHYLHSEYSICRDWTNGTAEWPFHSTNFHRHSLHDIPQILTSQQRRKEQNDSNYGRYFMGYGMYDLWTTKQIRYCVVMTIRDPRNRMLSRINTMYRGKGNQPSIGIEDKNKIFQREFNRQYLENAQIWWNKFAVLERENVMDYYLYFYEDIRRFPFRILKEIIWFAGLEEFINDKVIRYILSESDIEKRRHDVDIINQGNICSFHAEQSLFDDTKRRANVLMTDVLTQELIDRFNESCKQRMNREGLRTYGYVLLP